MFKKMNLVSDWNADCYFASYQLYEQDQLNEYLWPPVFVIIDEREK